MKWANVDDLLDPTHPYAESALEDASWLLYQLTGQKWPGIHITTEAYGGTLNTFRTSPMVIRGQMYNIPVEMIDSGPSRMRLELKHTPVREIIQVREQGMILPPDDYSLRNSLFLRKTNYLPWIYNDASELLVTYEYGANPPESGKQAAIRLANEFLLYQLDDDRCALPQSVTSISRQGVSVHVLDPQSFLQDGRTGIYSVDLFIKSANPRKSRVKPKLYVPGRIRGETL